MVSPPKLEMLVTVTLDVHLWYGMDLFMNLGSANPKLVQVLCTSIPISIKKSQQGESVVNIVTIAAKFL